MENKATDSNPQGFCEDQLRQTEWNVVLLVSKFPFAIIALKTVGSYLD